MIERLRIDGTGGLINEAITNTEAEKEMGRYPRRYSSYFRNTYALCVWTAVFFVCLPLLAVADVDVDIRVSGMVGSHPEQVGYVASIADCTGLSNLQVSSGGFQNTFAPSETTRLQGSATGCQLSFEGTGAGSL